MDEKVWTGQPLFPRTMSVVQLKPEEEADLIGGRGEGGEGAERGKGGKGGKGGEGGEGAEGGEEGAEGDENKNVPRPIFR